MQARAMTTNNKLVLLTTIQFRKRKRRNQLIKVSLMKIWTCSASWQSSHRVRRARHRSKTRKRRRRKPKKSNFKNSKPRRSMHMAAKMIAMMHRSFSQSRKSVESTMPYWPTNHLSIPIVVIISHP